MAKILVIGGGFGGIRTALDLAKDKRCEVTLVSDKPHFEYFPSLYRVVTGRSPLQVCVPLAEVFKSSRVSVVQDLITHFDFTLRTAYGEGSKYSYDHLVLALGSETAYFNIPGLKELAFGFKSITEALRLKNHLHEVMKVVADKDEAVRRAHVVVVGGGATGTEVMGELAVYVRALAAMHGVDPSLVTLDLIEAAPRLLPGLPPAMSARVKEHLQGLGVNVFLNRAVMKEDVDGVYLKDMEMKTQTVIWTAGVAPNRLYAATPALPKDKRGRVVVDEHLQAQGLPGVFVIGDGASTQFTGLAQTAIYDGEFAARTIRAKVAGKPLSAYVPHPVAFNIPAGPDWAVFVWGPIRMSGRIAVWLKRLIDLKYFLSILSLSQAFTAFRSGGALCETCPICGGVAQATQEAGAR